MLYLKRSFLLLTLVIISCNAEPQNKTNQQPLNDPTISTNKNIFGTWSMCASYGKETMVQYNTCPIIIFKKTGTGVVERNSIILENFTWTLKELHLKILCNSISAGCTFPDTNYYADFNKRIDGVDLILRHNGQSYYLSKGVIK